MSSAIVDHWHVRKGSGNLGCPTHPEPWALPTWQQVPRWRQRRGNGSLPRQTRDFRDGRTPSQEISTPSSAWRRRNPPHRAPAAIKGLPWSSPTSPPAGLTALQVTHRSPTCGSRNILTGCSPLGPQHRRRPACCSSFSRGWEIRPTPDLDPPVDLLRSLLPPLAGNQSPVRQGPKDRGGPGRGQGRELRGQAWKGAEPGSGTERSRGN